MEIVASIYCEEMMHHFPESYETFEVTQMRDRKTEKEETKKKLSKLAEKCVKVSCSKTWEEDVIGVSS